MDWIRLNFVKCKDEFEFNSNNSIKEVDMRVGLGRKFFNRLGKEEFLRKLKLFKSGRARNTVLMVFESEKCCRLQDDHKFDMSIGIEVVAKEDTVIKEGQCSILPTGVKWAANWEYGNYLAILPRSGMSSYTPLRIPNAPGTVEPTYRGEIGVPMYVESGWRPEGAYCKDWIRKLGKVEWKGIEVRASSDCEGEYEVVIPAGTRIAQLVLQVNFMVWALGPYVGINPFIANQIEVLFTIDKEIFDNWAELVPTDRGTGGYGSTGTK